MEQSATNYLEINKQLWNERTKHHVSSDFYDMPAFLNGKSSLKRPELDLLGNVSGKSLLHLQCHFGQDTLSLARMGAKATGVDFSEEAIKEAEALNARLGLDATFICCNVYDTRQFVEQQFDIVFSSYGTIGWLPDLKPWAKVVSDSLKSDGQFVFAEFHPVVWMFDNSLQKVAYSYFNHDAIIEQEEGTYADKTAPINNNSVSWNHSLGEVIQALLDEGLRLEHFKEYDYSPYDIFENGVKLGEDKYVVKGMEQKLPLMYTLKFTKP